MSQWRPFKVLVMAALLLTAGVERATAGQAEATQPTRTGQQVYESICITCHGPDGRAGVNLALEQIRKPPDFTDCALASREPDRQFLAVAHNGGPARGFSPLMAPWGSTYTEQELQLAIGHIRTFCKDDRWPRGELNLPLALVTGKAFPEDEAVVRVASQSGKTVTKVVYERRFGALNQWEVALPIQSADAGRGTGIGDIALGYKRVFAHSLVRGNIFSGSAEVTFPTGSEDKQRGEGVAVVEPFLTFGQIIRGSGFLQAQGGFGLPASSERTKEVFWRAALGRSFEQGHFGRLWSPMLEVAATRALVSGAGIDWDLAPGTQVTLNTRQHIRLGVGMRFPVTDASVRPKSLNVYLLWDWYEGGFFQGW
jgi:hypothetical protein